MGHHRHCSKYLLKFEKSNSAQQNRFISSKVREIIGILRTYNDRKNPLLNQYSSSANLNCKKKKGTIPLPREEATSCLIHSRRIRI